MVRDQTSTSGADRRWRGHRTVLVRAAFVVVATALVAGAVVLISARDQDVTSLLTPGPLATQVLTPDGDDSYVVTRNGSSVRVAPAATNTAGNLRVALTDPNDRPHRDQQVCATWPGPLQGKIQPGLALRVRPGDDGPARAITVTNNIWSGIRWQWNVHVWEDGAGRNLKRTFLDRSFEGVGVRSMPWNICARVVGSEVSFVVWPDALARPGWSDPERSVHVTLPPGWEEPGLPGWYVGHVPPGGSTSYDHLAAWTLDDSAPPREGRWSLG